MFQTYNYDQATGQRDHPSFDGSASLRIGISMQRDGEPWQYFPDIASNQKLEFDSNLRLTVSAGSFVTSAQLLEVAPYESRWEYDNNAIRYTFLITGDIGSSDVSLVMGLDQDNQVRFYSRERWRVANGMLVNIVSHAFTVEHNRVPTVLIPFKNDITTLGSDGIIDIRVTYDIIGS